MRGHPHQRARHPPRRRGVPRRRRQGDGDDLDRQGGQSRQRHGRDQAAGREHLPGARSRGGEARGRHALRHRAVRQRARLDRLGGAAVPAPARGGRAAHRDPSRDLALLHDRARGGRAGAAGLGAGPRRGRAGQDFRARHGPADQDRRPRAADDPPRRPEARQRREDRLYRTQAGREACRGAVPRRRAAAADARRGHPAGGAARRRLCAAAALARRADRPGARAARGAGAGAPRGARPRIRRPSACAARRAAAKS